LKKFIKMVFFELKDSFRARWFYIYFLIFFGMMVGFLWSGVTASEVLGFTGLTRVLVAYIEITVIILPLFILISASRSVVAEKEFFILEYILSFPVSIGQYYWGKFVGKFITILIPVYLAFLASVLWGGVVKHFVIPWNIYFIYATLLISLSISFLGLAFLISSLSQKQDTAIFMGFFVWLFFVLFIDVGILGLFLKFGIDINIVLAMALANPLDLFRIAAFSLFDPKLAAIGPIAWTLLGKLGNNGLLALAFIYPSLVGIIMGIVGYVYFKHGDYI